MSSFVCCWLSKLELILFLHIPYISFSSAVMILDSGPFLQFLLTQFYGECHFTLKQWFLFFREVFPKADRQMLPMEAGIYALFDGNGLKISFPQLLEKLFVLVHEVGC